MKVFNTFSPEIYSYAILLIDQLVKQLQYRLDNRAVTFDNQLELKYIFHSCNGSLPALRVTETHIQQIQAEG